MDTPFVPCQWVSFPPESPPIPSPAGPGPLQLALANHTQESLGSRVLDIPQEAEQPREPLHCWMPAGLGIRNCAARGEQGDFI